MLDPTVLGNLKDAWSAMRHERHEDVHTRAVRIQSCVLMFGRVKDFYPAFSFAPFPEFVQKLFHQTEVRDVFFSGAHQEHRGLFATQPIQKYDFITEMAMPRRISQEDVENKRTLLRIPLDNTTNDFIIQRGKLLVYDDTWELLTSTHDDPALRALLCGHYGGNTRKEYMKPRWYYMNNAESDQCANVSVHIRQCPLLLYFVAKRDIDPHEELRWNYNQSTRVPLPTRPRGVGDGGHGGPRSRGGCQVRALKTRPAFEPYPRDLDLCELSLSGSRVVSGRSRAKARFCPVQEGLKCPRLLPAHIGQGSCTETRPCSM